MGRNPGQGLPAESLPAVLADGVIHVVIESAKGSRNKFKFDEKSGMFKLSKVLPEGMVFPHDFGFVPSTKAADGDPLDVLVLLDEPTFPGCVVECRLIGVIEAEQEQEGRKYRNDRLIAVAQASVLHACVKHIRDLNPALLKQLEAFFVNYQRARDVKCTIIGNQGPAEAMHLLTLAQASHG